MTTPKSIMIFAAGLGTRMRPLTDTQAKPLIPVAGKPLLDHAMDLVNDAAVPNRVINLHYRANDIRAHLAGQSVVFSDETPALLETGGGLRHALPLLGTDPVFTLNTDAVWNGPNPLCSLASAWNPATMDALLLLIRPENAIGHRGTGDFNVDTNGRLTRGPGTIYAGAQIIKTDRLAAMPSGPFSLNLIWDQMQTDHRLFGQVSDGKWCDVGQPSSIPLAEKMIGFADVS